VIGDGQDKNVNRECETIQFGTTLPSAKDVKQIARSVKFLDRNLFVPGCWVEMLHGVAAGESAFKTA
jgi:hypothetical protein